MTLSATMAGARTTHTRYFILLMLFLATTINYADRATLSIAGTPLAKELHIDPAAMGYLFFAWLARTATSRLYPPLICAAANNPPG